MEEIQKVVQLLEFPSLPLLLATLAFIFFLVKRSSAKSSQKNVKLPPGPPKLPVIGHLHHMVGELPHRLLTRMARQYGPVIHLKLGEISTVVISSREAAKEVLKVQDPACADRPDSIGTKILWKGDFIFSQYNEFWRQMKKVATVEMLSIKNVRSYEYIRQEEAARLVATVRTAAGEAMDLTEKMYAYSSAMTCRAALGTVAKNNSAVLVELMKTANPMAAGFELADLFPSSKLLNILCLNKYKLMWMRRKLDKVLDAVVEEHKLGRSGEFGGEDTVDVLLRLTTDPRLQNILTLDGIKGVIFDLFTAGTETSSTTMNWAMTELMRSPRVMAKLQSEIRESLKGKTTVEDSYLQSLPYLSRVIKETLRLHPPVPLLPRACRTEDCTAAGYTIPKNAKVVVNAWSMGRDPKYWDRPDEFRPERFENNSVDFLGNDMELIPFGAGRRLCPGMNFGVANVVLPLSQLLYHFDWKLPEGKSLDDVDLLEVEGLVMMKKNPLILVPTPYKEE
ncbi:cytochrome P450 71D95-like [Andrographis paniculata]|uniref:cytochrome P450 71D95-like n=1 Tax=Andrographis paniculata TaxID=175694 RepID=UPI0021E73C13|nr:cytochrome P450 71D95-like [Andrographis paniculata]